MENLIYVQEGEALKERFVKLRKEKKISRQKFAEMYDCPGGDAMIYQHITGRRPISMNSALAYAKGFGVTLKEISQRLAEEAEKSAQMLKSDGDPVANPTMGSVLTRKIFPLACPECGKMSHKSFIELETNDRLPCDSCGVSFNINHQYGNGQLKEFLDALGYSGFILRQNRKFD